MVLELEVGTTMIFLLSDTLTLVAEHSCEEVAVASDLLDWLLPEYNCFFISKGNGKQGPRSFCEWEIGGRKEAYFLAGLI